MSAWNGQSRCLFMKCHLRQLAGLSLSRSHQAGPQSRSLETHCQAAVCEELEGPQVFELSSPFPWGWPALLPVSLTRAEPGWGGGEGCRPRGWEPLPSSWDSKWLRPPFLPQVPRARRRFSEPNFPLLRAGAVMDPGSCPVTIWAVPCCALSIVWALLQEDLCITA